MLPAAPEYDSTWALIVAIIYFGSVIGVGMALRVLCGWLMERTGADLDDVQAQAGPNRRSRTVFLLGAWRKED